MEFEKGKIPIAYAIWSKRIQSLDANRHSTAYNIMAQGMEWIKKNRETKYSKIKTCHENNDPSKGIFIPIVLDILEKHTQSTSQKRKWK